MISHEQVLAQELYLQAYRASKMRQLHRRLNIQHISLFLYPSIEHVLVLPPDNRVQQKCYASLLPGQIRPGEGTLTFRAIFLENLQSKLQSAFLNQYPALQPQRQRVELDYHLGTDRTFQ